MDGMGAGRVSTFCAMFSREALLGSQLGAIRGVSESRFTQFCWDISDERIDSYTSIWLRLLEQVQNLIAKMVILSMINRGRK